MGQVHLFVNFHSFHSRLLKLSEATPSYNSVCPQRGQVLLSLFGTKMVTLFGRWNKRLLFGKSLSGGQTLLAM